jgi:hypothetical protein
MRTLATLPSKNIVYGADSRPAVNASPSAGAPRYQPYSHMRVLSDGCVHCVTLGVR